MAAEPNPWDVEWAGFSGLNLFGRLFWYNQSRCISRLIRSLGLGRESKVLDAGCGSGRTLKLLRALGYGSSVGIDLSDHGLEVCERYGLKIGKDVLRMDMTKMDFGDRSFPLVFSDGVLEHFKDVTPFVSELCRVSDKYVLLAHPDHFSLFGRILKRVRKVHEYSYTKEQYAAAMRKCGFELLSSESYNFREGMLLLFRRI